MKRLLVNVEEPGEVRVALADDHRLLEYQIEETTEKTQHGNIYLGRVVNIEPGIQAAFIDLGEERSGFLHVSDVHHAYGGARRIPVNRFDERPPEQAEKTLIQNLLTKGQEVLVQVSKEAIGHKGPSVTTFVSLPGRYLVLMAGMTRAGVSKKIEDQKARDDLRAIAENLKPPPHVGLIVRTAGAEQAKRDLDRDLKFLRQLWQGILEKLENGRAPALLHAESDVVIRTVRDLFKPEIEEIVIDDEAVTARVRQFLERVMPRYADRVKHFGGSTPIFHRFGVEKEIESIYDRKVPLPSGGSLVIDETEALVAIDVNSGRYRAEEDLEKTAISINLEAVAEIGRQLRLRDLGGVVVCDFIDMTEAKHRRRVEQALRQELRHDRAKTWFCRMSRFGIIEMTRQRLRPSKDRVARETCPTCAGRGTVRSARNVATAIFRQLQRGLGERRHRRGVVEVGAGLMERLANEKREQILELERKSGKRVAVRLSPDLAADQFRVSYE
ncbi:MAG: Rne/Rng family ribonuclease [Planctomycetes bacterium]|nr:Rne/Rng family ribonuclease [Planctomycetota bacterium]